MENTIASAIQNRTSIGHYDMSKDVTEEQIEQLVAYAIQAPSAFNLQNWQFVAVKSKDAKEKLKAAAYGQTQITESAMTFIVCGVLDGYQSLGAILSPSVEKGIISQTIADNWVAMATGSHHSTTGLQRDEAIRSASLASMTLMLAAQGMGLATGPIGGFDSKMVMESFSIDEQWLPTMLITVGYAGENNWSRKVRRPVREVLEIV